MPARFLRVFRFELAKNARRKGYLFGTFGIPLIAFILIMGYQVLNASGSLSPAVDAPEIMAALASSAGSRAGYVDHSGLLDDSIEPDASLTRYPDEDSARAALDSGDIDLYYVIAADYRQTGDVTVVMPRLSLGHIDDNRIRRLLLDRLAQEVDDPQVFQRLVAPAAIREISVQPDRPEGVERGEDQVFFVVYIFAIVLLASLFVTNGYLMQSVIEEKETRLIEILLSTVRPADLLAGKILALGLLGLFQILVWLGALYLLVRLGAAGVAGQAIALFANFYVPPALPPVLLAYFVLAYLMFAAFYSIVGALSNSMREGPQYAGLIALPAVVPLWFAQIFAASPDAPLPVALSLFPITAPLAMIQRLAVTTVPPWQIALSLGLLALAVVALMWMAGRIFRVQTLLAGQVPRLRDLPRLLRG